MNALTDGSVSRVHVETGFKPEDLHVSTRGDQLIVSGRHEVTEQLGSGDGHNTYVCEFQHSYLLPGSIDLLSLRRIRWSLKGLLLRDLVELGFILSMAVLLMRVISLILLRAYMTCFGFTIAHSITYYLSVSNAQLMTSLFCY
ncbi:hypothetical protein FBUS_09222 [Fasciolopsis buskii]|uniref:SHSP domain-containing protein n=1 Tax=Fasciolopsis buskii TaxID=27845 RepID=A0A8E0SAX1_9TREM|nr:hypothetical protein FBUS_09222 [Fasciolopsis buski]